MLVTQICKWNSTIKKKRTNKTLSFLAVTFSELYLIKKIYFYPFRVEYYIVRIYSEGLLFFEPVLQTKAVRITSIRVKFVFLVLINPQNIKVMSAKLKYEASFVLLYLQQNMYNIEH